MARSVVATDDFNRADGNLTTPWTQHGPSANVTILSNEVKDSHTNQAVARHGGTYTADQYAKIRISGYTASDGSRIGVVARCSSDASAVRDLYGYELHASGANGTTRLFKVVNGTRTELDTNTSIPWAINDTIEIEVEGTTLRGFRNGVEQVSLTDSDLATGNPGICAQTGSGAARGDDWEGGNLTGGGFAPGRAINSNSIGHVKPVIY